MLPEQAKSLLNKIIEDAEPTGESAPGRALALPRLRPYLLDKHVVRTLLAGSKVLCACAFRGLRRGVLIVFTEQAKKPPAKAGKPSSDGKEKDVKAAPAEKANPALDWLERLAIGLLGTAIAGIVVTGVVVAVGPQLLPYLPIATGVAVPAWIVAAWMVAPEKPQKKAPVPILKTGESPTQPPLDAAAVAELVRRIAIPAGWQGAQLDDLLAHLPGRSRGELLAVLAEAGIPVAEQLKLTLPGGRQRNRQGVRLSTLPEGLGEAPSAPVSPPGEHPSHHPAEVPPEPSPRVAPVTVHGGG